MVSPTNSVERELMRIFFFATADVCGSVFPPGRQSSRGFCQSIMERSLPWDSSSPQDKYEHGSLVEKTGEKKILRISLAQTLFPRRNLWRSRVKFLSYKRPLYWQQQRFGVCRPPAVTAPSSTHFYLSNYSPRSSHHSLVCVCNRHNAEDSLSRQKSVNSDENCFLTNIYIYTV